MSTAMLTLAGFTSLEKLQTGTYTEMYRAVRTVNQQKVMLKFLRKSALGTNNSIVRLQHEYFLLKQLNLPHIIHAYELIQEQQANPVLVLENIEGKFLNSYLNHQSLDPGQFFAIALQLVNILGSLHQNHITHKDLRPANVIIDPSSLNLTLIDLCVATRLEEEQDSLTRNLFDGDIAYLSPEQTGRMNRPVDYRTDFYSLGVVFYEMLSGTLPFLATDPLELIYYHIAKSPATIKEKNPAVPEIVSHLISKLMAKIPEERYASVSGLKADLSECARQWKENHRVKSFPLGLHDIHEHLTLSYKLYGRETELNTLSTIFNKVSQGNSELLIVNGQIGIGKTTLIQEMQKLIMRRKGYFIYGDFNRSQRDIPYNAIISAFQGLIKQILTEPEEHLTRIRKTLQQALGHIGQVIIDIIPAVELIIGKQPPLPSLSSTESLNRFNMVFQNFVRVFTKAEHPLVICLDDLQWADLSSLRFIKNLLTDPNTHHLLIIGTYPSNETDINSFFLPLLQEMQAAKASNNVITLSNLQIPDITQLLVDTFGCDVSLVHDLAEILFEKTQGSPFYIKEFLKALYQEQLLFFNYSQGKWEWDLARITQHSIADNVADVQITKIQHLSSSTQEMLKMAACLGFQCNLKELVAIYNEKLEAIAQSLREAIEQQLILPVGDAYEKVVLFLETNEKADVLSREFIVFCFAHDRIQQAAYRSIPETIRRETHLKIAHLLQDEHPLKENDERLFTVMLHFHQGLPLITDPQEKEQLAQHNLWAGRKAKLSVAYPMAITFFTSGINLITQNTWNTNSLLPLSLYRELIECEYATENAEDAEKHFQFLLPKAKINEKAELYEIKSVFYFNKDANIAIENARTGLYLLGIKLPQHPSSLYVFKRIVVAAYLLWRYNKQHHLQNLPQQLPATQNITHTFIGKLIFSVIISSFTSKPNTLAVAFCEAIICTLRHGLTSYSWTGFMGFALILIGGFQQFKYAIYLLEISHQLHKKTYFQSGDARFLTCEAVLFNHWYHHGTQCLNNLQDALQASMETGDLFFRSHIFAAYHSLSFFVSNSLTETNEIAEKAFRQLSAEKSEILDQIRFRYPALKFLQGQSKDLNAILKNWQKELAKPEGAYAGRDISSAILATVFYIMRNYSAAEKILALTTPNVTLKSTLYDIEYKTIWALILFTQNKTKRSIIKRVTTWLTVKSVIKQAATWKKINPGNFSHVYYLLLAEKARSNKKYLTAMRNYDKAIKAAKENNFLRYLAIANERAAQLYFHLKQDIFAASYLHQAYQAYELWGALAKCVWLKQTYPNYFSAVTQESENTVTSKPHEGLDFMAIVKATQAISSVIELGKLLEKLLSTVLQVAGAERAVLLTQQGSQWIIQAESAANTQSINLFQAALLEKAENLPITLLQYVLRTKESLLVDDASKVERDLRVYDSYISHSRPKSLFILPISYQGEMRYVLYLENNLITHAFTVQHTQSLHLLATQAAISLQNAHLFYQSTHDPLTGLANRNLLYQTFNLLASAHERDKKYHIAILFFDLDHFKQINDTLGHEVGDKMLIHVAHHLKASLNKNDLAVRLGGDEFVLMLGNIEHIEQVKETTEQLRNKLLADPLIIAGHELPVSCSIGISLYPEDEQDIASLLKQADAALYLAKESGRNCYQFYSAAINQSFQVKKKLQAELQRAFEQDELFLYYQPIYAAKTGRIISVEALLRWQHPEKGLLDAKEFIHLIKQSNLVAQLDDWVLAKVCNQLKLWQSKDITLVPIAINLCNFQSKFDSLSQRILTALKTQQIDPRYLELELTETILIADVVTALTELKILREHGIQITIDDFGIGFSNLGYLKQLPMVNKIKIDQSFVRDLKENETSRAIILAMLTLAHHLRIQVIAEGVETEEQYRFLNQHGVDGIQGYFLQKPIDATKCEQLLVISSK